MSKKVESKKLVGTDNDLYAKIAGLRKLRTDWDAFNPSQVVLTKEVVWAISKFIFQIGAEDEKLFKFLQEESWSSSRSA